ncbi:MAG: acylphosphatase [Candidatus Micrarchaeales archaeon]|nr:acylphosphatase [Candidatus Micrarchaeales archaeon]
MAREFLVVHGIVQGVGYRHFVWRTALKFGIRGFVRNAEDGSVEILADAEPDKLKKFTEDINVDFQNGPQVFSIEIQDQKLKDFEKRKFADFSIEE